MYSNWSCYNKVLLSLRLPSLLLYLCPKKLCSCPLSLYKHLMIWFLQKAPHRCLAYVYMYPVLLRQRKGVTCDHLLYRECLGSVHDQNLLSTHFLMLETDARNPMAGCYQLSVRMLIEWCLIWTWTTWTRSYATRQFTNRPEQVRPLGWTDLLSKSLCSFL